MPHHRSKYYDTNTWDRLQKFISSLPQGEGIMVIGDMNARIGLEIPAFEVDGRTCNVGRSSDDFEINELGKRLIGLCSDRMLIPLNGLRYANDRMFCLLSLSHITHVKGE